MFHKYLWQVLYNYVLYIQQPANFTLRCHVQEYQFDKVFARLDGIEKQIKVLLTPTVQCSSNLAWQQQFAVQAPRNQPVVNQPWDASQLDTSVTSVELDTSAGMFIYGHISTLYNFQ